MKANIVTRVEIDMSKEEQEMLYNVEEWIEDMYASNEIEAMPEGIHEILDDIHDDIHHLLSLIPGGLKLG